MKPKEKRMLAWLLAATVTLSGNPFTVLAEEMDFADVQEISAEEEIQPEQDNSVETELQVQDNFQSEETEEPVVEETEEPQTEAETETETTVEEVTEGLQEEPLFSAGKEENAQDPEEYKIWFENLRDQEYSTYFFDNENGELRLNTENLEGKNASISWEVGSRTSDPGGLGNDEFTTETGLPEDMIFWSENAENNSILEINGAKLQEAIRWLSDNKGNEYWFEVRAYVKAEGENEPVYLEQAGLYVKEHVEDYQLPGDEILLRDWDYWVNREYSCYVENADNLNGRNVPLEVTNLSVENVPDEDDETPVCEVNAEDTNGWNIRARRFGTAVVTLTYKNIQGEEQQYSFRLNVNGHKFTLEPQWPASGNNMLKNSEMTVAFVLHHDWKNSDEDQGSEDMTGWTLELDPDQNGYVYDTNLLDVDVHGEEHTITIRSKENIWGTGIALRALHPSDDEAEEPTYSYVNIPVQVCEEYDVLYPENIENINVGDVLDFNQCDLKVEHIKEGEESWLRDDVTYDFEYDTNLWTDEASEGQHPILKRKASDGTQINVIARDRNGNEICRRGYWFDGLDYSVWFENLRENEYATYFFNNESGELQLNTDHLNGKNVSVSWEAGYRTDDQNGSRDDEFTSDTGLPEELVFWSENPENNNVLQINGEKLWKAYKWLEENKGNDFWFEARAYVKVQGETVYSAQAGINTRECTENYYLPEDEVFLVDQDYWVNKNYNGYVQNQENPDGRDFNFSVTDVSVSNAEDEENVTPVCEINTQNENGWNIQAKRLGTAVVTLIYNDISGEEQQHSFKLYVNSDRFILEPQWPAEGSCMLKNSETTVEFVLYHEWKHSEEELGSEEVKDWTLEFAPDENGYAYDTNLLDVVEINGHKIKIKSGEKNWGTDILLKAMIPAENGEQEDAAYSNAHIEVCEEYDVLYPESMENVSMNEVLNLNDCGLKVEHVREKEASYIRDDVAYDFEYDPEQWEKEASEGQLPILRRKTSDGAWINVIARDERGQEICRREYSFDGFDYSVWFENLREDDYWTYAFQGEKYELRINTENITDKNTEIQWNVGYRTDEEAEGGIQFTEDIPEEIIFWSLDKKDSGKITIDADKLNAAYNWLYGEENPGPDYWFEVRANILNGDEVVSQTAAGLRTVRENIEEYQLSFGATLETVPGEDVWLDQTFDCYVENPEYPYGQTFPVNISKVRTQNKEIYSLVYLNNGWRMTARKPGKTRIEITYTDIHEKQQTGFFDISVTDVFYWCSYIPKDTVDSILSNSEKQYELSAYYRNAQNPDGVKVDSSKCNFEVVEGSYDENVVESAKIEGSTLTIKVKDIEDSEVSVRVRAVSKERDENNEPQWSAETEIYAYTVKNYSAQIKVEKIIDVNPEVGKTFDLKEYGPYIARYDSETQTWEKTEENENIRIRLEYDKDIWKAVSEDGIPALERVNAKKTNVRVIAEERHIDRFGAEIWERIAEDSYFFFTVYDKNAECSHIWETVKDSDPTCGKPGKRHQECSACQMKQSFSDIPATGKHVWKTVTDIKETCGKAGKRHQECTVCKTKKNYATIAATGKHKWGRYTVTKKATVFAQGEETRVCSTCKKKETRKTAKLKAALNLSAYAFPLQQGRSVDIRVSGLQNGDYIKLVSSSRSSVLRAVKMKNGAIRLTAQRSSRRNKIAVKVYVKTAGGAGRTITVTVQNGKVATTRITGVAKSLTIKRGRIIALKPIRNPFTSQDPIRYASSNKKIAYVDSKGQIKGVAPGQAVITIKSGSAVFRCTIKVVR